ncbi:hypothetical protein EV356DRAFT_532629 [Viridothelium virens]|uniref:Uncharacterized protein n=1 Tax=Viridothelium virens TaxID=1048519 RepID=A0A6A6H981_VIRVR|nr:hypothetical protein EV356DRAFT_532629 [Viridothelium virens]
MIDLPCKVPSIIVFLSIFTNGSIATLPGSSIHNLKPLLVNQTLDSYNQSLCKPDTCGDVCSAASRESSATNSSTVSLIPTFTNKTLMNNAQKRTPSLPKRTLIPFSALPDPGAYVRELSKHISGEGIWLSPQRSRRFQADSGVTGKKAWRYPESGVGVVGVNGLLGCTSIIVISRNGVFLSHIWEVPNFADQEGDDQSSNIFLDNAYNILREDEDGLNALTQPEEILGPENGPEAFIITPNANERDRMRGIFTALRYPRKIARLEDNLHDLFGRPPQVIGYTRRTSAEVSLHGYQRTSRRPWLGVGGRAIVEVDMNGIDFAYTPGDGSVRNMCLREWRLWVEDRVILSRYFTLPYVRTATGLTIWC